MKTLRLVIGIFMLVGLAYGAPLSLRPAAAQQEGEKNQNIRFLWAFGAMVRQESGSKLVPVTRDMELKTGDQLKFFVKLEKSGFVYVIYQSSQGELSVLFPYRFDQAGEDQHTQVPCYVPQGDEWFALDEHVGQETFYLLASAKRLDGLEALINRYETADPSKKQDLAKEIIGEIRRSMRENRRFKTYAEKPVTIMGHLRGTGKVGPESRPDVAELAVEISGQNFYSRTFTIDHK